MDGSSVPLWCNQWLQFGTMCLHVGQRPQCAPGWTPSVCHPQCAVAWTPSVCRRVDSLSVFCVAPVCTDLCPANKARASYCIEQIHNLFNKHFLGFSCCSFIKSMPSARNSTQSNVLILFKKIKYYRTWDLTRNIYLHITFTVKESTCWLEPHTVQPPM